MTLLETAEEYARRQWPDGASEDYVEGSKTDYLQGYHDAVDKALELLREYRACIISNSQTIYEFSTWASFFRKELEK